MFLMFMISALVSVVMIEGVVRIYESLFIVDQKNSKGMYLFDDVLGWKLVDGRYKQVHQDFDVEYSVKNGRRISLNKDKVDNINPVVNFYGDSFCFGTGVMDAETVPSYLSSMNGSLSVNNYGVAGYGPLQYYLKYMQTGSDYLNVFMIYTGNDYQDVQKSKIAWGPNKPVLTVAGDGYSMIPPEKDFNLILEDNDKKYFELRFPDFVKNLLKSIPFIVAVRNEYIMPDVGYVNESINRMEYVLGKIDKKKSLFVVVPSISLVSGISINSDEGYFREEILKYLSANQFYYVDILDESGITKNDFWRHEGHNNQLGNEKIAAAINNYINFTFLPEWYPHEN